MNERQAREAGYSFTGIWERTWKKEIVKEKAKALRKQGNKAIMVNDEGGYSVYWIESPENIAIREAKFKTGRILFTQNEITRKLQELEELKLKLEELSK